jgi:hypothetical protein
MQNEREDYEVIIENGMLLWKNSRLLVHTNEGSKWIFVLSTTKVLYVGEVDILFHSNIISVV